MKKREREREREFNIAKKGIIFRERGIFFLASKFLHLVLRILFGRAFNYQFKYSRIFNQNETERERERENAQIMFSIR